MSSNAILIIAIIMLIKIMFTTTRKRLCNFRNTQKSLYLIISSYTSCPRVMFVNVLIQLLISKHFFLGHPVFLLTWESKENPCSKFTSGSQTSKIKFPNWHSDSVFHRVNNIIKVSQFGIQDKIKETAEGSEHNYKLNNKSRKSNEAKFDCGCNLLKSFLETEIRMLKQLNKGLKGLYYTTRHVLLY